MGKTFLFNDTNAPKIMGGKWVPAGEGREVDDTCMPAGEGPAPAAAEGAPVGDLDANLRAMLEPGVKQIVPLLADASDETLAGLARLENATEAPRKTLLAAIAEQQLNRAQAKTGAPT